MTSALGIAGVSAVLRNLLRDGLINHEVAGMLGSSITVSIGPPDKVVSANGSEVSQLNLFLHRVTPNTGWTNNGLPSRDESGNNRLSNPPLALNLHYLISAYSGADLHGEILLGYAMQLLHETPVLTRKAIQTALNSDLDVDESLPLALRALADSGLENQYELIRITPEYLNTEEISKLWAATLSHLRPTAAYVASVVLIEATDPIRSPIPVLTRGPVDQVTGRERGVVAATGVVPPLPAIESIAPDAKQPAAVLGKKVDLKGHHLNGSNRTVTLFNDRFEVEGSLPVTGPDQPDVISFTIPAARKDDFPVGVYRVGARLTPPGETAPRNSNRLAMTLAPDITDLPGPVARVNGTASFSVKFLPALRPGQTVALVLGQQEYQPESLPDLATELDFVIPDAGAAPAPGHLVRLRIDGIDSSIIDYTTEPPSFLDKRIVIS